MTTQLRDSFADPQSREDHSVVFIDQVGSTAMKEQQPESNWLPGLGWLYDTVTTIAMQGNPDAEIKYLGDGIMITFDSDRATEAVNVAIQVQESINDANLGRTGAKGAVDFTCSVGVGTGPVVAFLTPTGGRDYVGTVVDKARRLCDAASPKGILIDRATAAAANIMRIASRVGTALGRTPEQYQGDVQRIPLKGFDQPVDYYEVFWDQQLHGLKSEGVTSSADRMRAVAAPAAGPAGSSLSVVRPAGKPGSPEERHVGEVTCWKPESNFGFIRDQRTGEDFYFRGGHMVYPEDATESLAVGSRAVFLATGRTDNNRRRFAIAILLVGEYAEGTLRLPEGKAHGWLRVTDELGNSHHVFTPRASVSQYAPGTVLSFRVGSNEKGGIAEEIELPEAEAAA
jgi:class 3 adenylate cyclase/cold shock CspA family protein